MRVLPVLLCCLTAACAKTASVDLGNVDRSAGLSVPSGGDGLTEAVQAAGREARRTVGRTGTYLYVCADPAVLPPGDHTLYLTIEVLDDGPRVIGVQYDSVAAEPTLATKYLAGPPFVLFGTGKWVHQTVRLEHARLGHGQNQGADLRLSGHSTVARIELSDTPPAGFDPHKPYNEADLAAIRTTIGAGQELCFGGEAGPETALLMKSLGVTSLESYVAWQTIEDAGRGQYNWAKWDQQVAVLEQAGLKWVPFVIAGPAYANPKWFREGAQHVPYVCLEHGESSKVESLWNPALRPEIERFLKAVADRYAGRRVIESVLLGISGIYGESIYPAGPSDGWTMDIPGAHHNHGGWWAGDRLATADFRAAMQRKYATVARLNAAWGAHHADFAAVTTFLPAKAPNAVAREDLVRWYEQSMTEWARWWSEAARRAFPRQRIYLCTGGDGAPYLGADFTAQAKAIAPYNVGIRITNEGSDYAANFAVTREVATATRLYRTFCGFEPASGVDEHGVVARVYNAAASGAACLHYYTDNVLGSPEGTASFRRVAAQLQRRQPQVPQVAVYLPRAAWAQDPAWVGRSLELARQWREDCDLDLVNATSLADGVLAGHRLLVLPTEADLEPAAQRTMAAWQAAGGLVVTFDARPAAGLVQPLADAQAPGRLRILVGAPGDGAFLSGDWNGPETGGEFPTPGATKRWSTDNSELWLPTVPGRAFSLELDVLVPDAALRGVSGAITLDGRTLGTLKPGRAIYRFDVAATAAPLAKLSFAVKGWRPSEVAGTGDNRLLGLAVSRVEVVTEAAAPAVVNAGLKVGVKPGAVPVTPVGRGARIVLPSVPGPAREALVREVLGPVATSLGAPGLLDPATGGGVYVTPLAHGRLLLNMTGEQVTRGGVTVEPWGITQAP